MQVKDDKQWRVWWLIYIHFLESNLEICFPWWEGEMWCKLINYCQHWSSLKAVYLTLDAHSQMLSLSFSPTKVKFGFLFDALFFSSLHFASFLFFLSLSRPPTLATSDQIYIRHTYMHEKRKERKREREKDARAKYKVEKSWRLISLPKKKAERRNCLLSLNTSSICDLLPCWHLTSSFHCQQHKVIFTKRSYVDDWQGR